jgi:quercetin dioxygenase-like cupin family protein
MEDKMEKGKVFKIAEKTAYQSAGIVSSELIRTENGTITIFAFDQGQGLSEHTAPFDAFVTILEGTAEVTLGGTPHSLSSGEAVIMPAGIAHSVRAIEPFRMLLVLLKTS